MRKGANRLSWWGLAVVASGGAFLCGCDEGVTTTLQDGVIDASTSFLGALLQAIIAVASEGASTTAMIVSSF